MVSTWPLLLWHGVDMAVVIVFRMLLLCEPVSIVVLVSLVQEENQ